MSYANPGTLRVTYGIDGDGDSTYSIWDDSGVRLRWGYASRYVPFAGWRIRRRGRRRLKAEVRKLRRHAAMEDYDEMVVDVERYNRHVEKQVEVEIGLDAA